MRILQIYVENFGKLHNFNKKFEVGINIVKEDNGWGKSTMGAFIKAMFYGLSSTTKRSLRENERKKYTPWQGGKFGGNLDFELKGKQYRIERFFAVREKDDLFRVYNLQTGRESKEFSSNIGEEVFSLDAEAYERSTYFSQRESQKGVNNSLAAKLSNLIDNTNDINNFDSAMFALDTARKEYLRQGNKGIIADTAVKLEELDREIELCETASERVAQYQQEINQKEEKIAELVEKVELAKKAVAQAAVQKTKIAHAQTYARYDDEIKILEGKLSKLNEKFSNRDITLEQIESYIEMNTKFIQEESSYLKELKEFDELKDEIARLQKYFKGNPTTAEEIEDFRKKNITLNKITSEAIIACERATEMKKEVDGFRNYVTKVMAPWLLALMITAGVSAITGIVLCFIMVVVGVALIVVSLILGLASAVLYAKRMMKLNGDVMPNIELLNQQYDAAITEAETKEKARGSYLKNIKKFIERFDEPEEDFFLALGNIHLNLRELTKAFSKKNEKEATYKAALRIKEETEKKIKDFALGFDEENFTKSLLAMKTTFEEKNKINVELGIKRMELGEFVDEKQIDVKNLVVEDLIDLEDYQNKESKIQKQLDDLNEERTTLLTEMQRAIESTEKYEELIAKRDSYSVIKDDAEKRYEIVKKTMDFLSEAKENISANYLAPMRAGFKKYVEMITDEDLGYFMMDTDLELKFSKYGESKSVEYFSEGYQDIFDICTRLALNDVLFTDEKPFVILDDPFVNLDDLKVLMALDLLKRISEEYQVVYLICHESRTFQ